ncbi:hypothetical protein F3Y22_tig00110418pilonHSYRG00328 [Hibiscus syriacus]|uniref:C2H2-type domain-containing protein n=1 Tax=Hibiscus syriacus TaxID=106335 RepID=A0A6A3AMH7_HIBSY|nr:hypothetical protein F3Y22_tig00110418pilonHSYRG00328 [Hibiscus syriacus]
MMSSKGRKLFDACLLSRMTENKSLKENIVKEEKMEKVEVSLHIGLTNSCAQIMEITVIQSLKTRFLRRRRKKKKKKPSRKAEASMDVLSTQRVGFGSQHRTDSRWPMQFACSICSKTFNRYNNMQAARTTSTTHEPGTERLSDTSDSLQEETWRKALRVGNAANSSPSKAIGEHTRRTAASWYCTCGSDFKHKRSLKDHIRSSERTILLTLGSTRNAPRAPKMNSLTESLGRFDYTLTCARVSELGIARDRE